MKVKYKLFLSLLFLFGVIILLGGFGSYYLRLLAEDSAAIMKDNNRTLVYVRIIENKLDSLQYKTLEETLSSGESADFFTKIYETTDFQLANFTEVGEEELTEKLVNDLGRLEALYQEGGFRSSEKIKDEILPLIKQIKQQTDQLYVLNSEAMLRKNEHAAATAEKAVLYMNIFGGSCILAGLVFIIGLPIYISRPLETFAGAIKEVSRGNYKVSIPIRSRDEYGTLAGLFNLMAAKLDKFEHSNLAKVLHEQKRLNAVINHLDEVILGLDERKNVIFANDHCLKLLDLKREQVVGQHASSIAIHNQLMDSLIQELMIDFSDFEEKEYPSITIVEGKKEKLFTKNVIDVVETMEGESRKVLLGHVIVLTDITAFTEKDKAKTHFIATLSHELKTPVSAILLSTNLLRNAKSGLLNESQSELITTIENNSERIRRMINEVLDISKIENGSIDINLSTESPGNLIERAVDGVSLFLKDKNLAITILPISGLPMIKVDAHKLVWVLNNLLTNAIRYAPEGSSIEIRTRLRLDFLEISVTDHGLGIGLGNQKKIFQKFTKLENAEISGTGLGLAISKEFVEAMNGSIGVESTEGKGATFWVRLPVGK
ncbi:HAMP domain-containing histidine kinase [Algoriphagus terrigena]|uniref:HAMP domain-containing histidine kinase n=1 Tax=Algoriphagus terrigena TaxID=344884 RepID=UPI0004133112|nr:HAMP domain-containing histidine kinase [Algoriphagus terrigena]